MKNSTKFDELINNYINDYVKKFLNRWTFGEFIIYYGGDEEPIIEYDYEDQILWIDKIFFGTLVDIFSLDEKEAVSKIFLWFEAQEDCIVKSIKIPSRGMYTVNS